jgi:hypothetical protein
MMFLYLGFAFKPFALFALPAWRQAGWRDMPYCR